MLYNLTEFLLRKPPAGKVDNLKELLLERVVEVTEKIFMSCFYTQVEISPVWLLSKQFYDLMFNRYFQLTVIRVSSVDEFTL